MKVGIHFSIFSFQYKIQTTEHTLSEKEENSNIQ